jgi:hypothetical protein
LARRETQVSESQQRIAEEAARLDALRAQIEQDRQRLALEQEEQRARAQLADGLQSERVEWQQQVQQQQTELRAEREAIAASCRRWQEDREQQQQALQRDRVQLEQRQASLERSRAEVLRLHREALEMRLVVEQLWTQLVGRAPPAELAAGVSKLHRQLADEYRFATQELETQRTSLRELIGRLDQKQLELAEQRNELIDWFHRRQADLAHKAAELSRREQEANAERRNLRDQQQEWKSERRRMQQQLEQLEARQQDHELAELASTAAN